MPTFPGKNLVERTKGQLDAAITEMEALLDGRVGGEHKPYKVVVEQASALLADEQILSRVVKLARFGSNANVHVELVDSPAVAIPDWQAPSILKEDPVLAAAVKAGNVSYRIRLEDETDDDEDLWEDPDNLWEVQARWIIAGGLEVTSTLGYTKGMIRAGDLMEFAASAEARLKVVRRDGSLRLITNDGRVFVVLADKVIGVYVELLTPFGDVVEHLEPGYVDRDGPAHEDDEEDDAR